MSSVTIPSGDGSGSFSAYVAKPSSGKGPGILVIQEIFGINTFIRQMCDDYAARGYVAYAPDLFWRLEPGLDLDSTKEADSAKAFSLFPKFNVEKGVEDLIATLAAMRGDGSVTGKVGAVGYCLGGKLAYLMATRSDVDASVGYYGVCIQDLLGEASAITKPLMLHVAELDKFVPPDAQEKIKHDLAKNPVVDVHVYAGVDHAFARNGGDHYDAAAATLANQRTESFFKKHLGDES
jgi:carboxymethylenebutenolidase